VDLLYILLLRYVLTYLVTKFLILCYGRSYISCYYVIDSPLLMLIHIFLLRYLTYVAVFLQKLLSLLTAK